MTLTQLIFVGGLLHFGILLASGPHRECSIGCMS